MHSSTCERSKKFMNLFSALGKLSSMSAVTPECEGGLSKEKHHGSRIEIMVLKFDSELKKIMLQKTFRRKRV